MKAYLLLCFFLLFYSINSHTKDNYQKKCEYVRRKCYDGCLQMKVTVVKDCELGCSRNYYKCLAINGN